MKKLTAIFFYIIAIQLKSFSQDNVQKEIDTLLKAKEYGTEYIDYSRLMYNLRKDSVDQDASISLLIKRFEDCSPIVEGFILELVYQIAHNSEFLSIRQKCVYFLISEYYHPLANKRDVIAFKKKDFTQDSKEIILDYLNQSFDTNKVKNQWCKFNVNLDLTKNKSEKLDNKILDSICYLNYKKYTKNVVDFLKVTPEIILLSGWLDLNNSISALSKIASTSESNEIINSSKLALARLGQGQFKRELLDQLNSTPWNANNKKNFNKKNHLASLYQFKRNY